MTLNFASESFQQQPRVMRNGIASEPEDAGNCKIVTGQTLIAWRRIAACIVTTIWADICIYQGSGAYMGWAVFLLSSSLVFWMGIGSRFHRSMSYWTLLGLSIGVARLTWQGNTIILICTMCGLLAWCMRLHGLVPGWRACGSYLLHLVPSAVWHWPQTLCHAFGLASCLRGTQWLPIAIPAVVCCLFSVLFIMANPAAIDWFSESLNITINHVIKLCTDIRFTQWIFWIFFGTLSFGLLVPVVVRATVSTKDIRSNDIRDFTLTRFLVGRNTLLSVVCLFSGYLIIETISIWGREFPVGFHYSGFAHQGAAWLTLALALTTLILGLIFPARTRQNEKTLLLQRLATVWMVLNWLLAIAAYNRLMIYVQYNGMTRMRIFGFLGITCVVVGLYWAIRRIKISQHLFWLLHRQVATVIGFIAFYSILPVDFLAHRYNTRCVSTGQLPPLVQITEQDLSEEAWLGLLPLLENEDPLIRDGMRAMLADKWITLGSPGAGWHSFQGSDWCLHSAVKRQLDLLSPFLEDAGRREQAVHAMRDFAYQWY